MNKKSLLIIAITIGILGYSTYKIYDLTKEGGQNKMTSFKKSIVVDFPLRGEWIAPNTPGKKIPSHGTNEFGVTYAYDFVRIEKRYGIKKFYNSSLTKYLLKGVPLEECFGWGKDIFSPCDAEIVKVEDGVNERERVSLIGDLRYRAKINDMHNKGEFNYRDIAGNYIIMKCSESVYALFAHLKKDSILVDVGERVKKGQVIGKVGHSGNSLAPHLHFQMMDNEDPRFANGILCAFEYYEIKKEGEWIKIENGIPTHKETIKR
jgi:hypothetical protein